MISSNDKEVNNHGVSEAQIQAIFDQYIYGFIFHDIQREIDLAIKKAHWEDGTEIGGGNVLAALGLLCYTEFMGGVLTGLRGRGTSQSKLREILRLSGQAVRRPEEERQGL